MKITKDHVVQVKTVSGWRQSINEGAYGLYTLAGAKRRAKQQMEYNRGMKYRAKKVKAKK